MNAAARAADMIELLGDLVEVMRRENEILKLPALAPGAYPYICTFPGHWRIMQGVLTVK